MPAALCGHTHFYGAFARGWAYPGPPAASFTEILERLWWRLDKALTLEDVRYSALVCLVDAIRHGTTTLIDHHASPNAIEGSLDVIADAVREAGRAAVALLRGLGSRRPGRGAGRHRRKRALSAANAERTSPAASGAPSGCTPR